jgi:hypothetical protein
MSPIFLLSIVEHCTKGLLGWASILHEIFLALFLLTLIREGEMVWTPVVFHLVGPTFWGMFTLIVNCEFIIWELHRIFTIWTICPFELPIRDGERARYI